MLQGDPAIIITEEGGDIRYKGGQPVMDKGIHNAIFISLYTKEGYWGNSLTNDPNLTIGKGYEESGDREISLNNLLRMEAKAEESLSWMVALKIISSVSAEVSNPISDRTKVDIVTTDATGRESLFTENMNNQFENSITKEFG